MYKKHEGLTQNTKSLARFSSHFHRSTHQTRDIHHRNACSAPEWTRHFADSACHSSVGACWPQY